VLSPFGSPRLQGAGSERCHGGTGRECPFDPFSGKGLDITSSVTQHQNAFSALACGPPGKPWRTSPGKVSELGQRRPSDLIEDLDCRLSWAAGFFHSFYFKSGRQVEPAILPPHQTQVTA
jgi:hypothetical protein